jgi:hypothetical protein
VKVIQNYILTLNYVKGKINHERLRNTLIYKAKQLMLTILFKKSLHILEDGASSVQVDMLNMSLSKIFLKCDKITLN